MVNSAQVSKGGMSSLLLHISCVRVGMGVLHPNVPRCRANQDTFACVVPNLPFVQPCRCSMVHPTPAQSSESSKHMAPHHSTACQQQFCGASTCCTTPLHHVQTSHGRAVGFQRSAPMPVKFQVWPTGLGQGGSKPDNGPT